MASKRGITRATRAKHEELEERIRQMRREEESIKAKIYKLEASIVAAPGAMMGERLRNRNVVPADEEEFRGTAFNRTRWQAQRLSHARSRQAVTALCLVLAFVGFVCWFFVQLRNSGIL